MVPICSTVTLRLKDKRWTSVGIPLPPAAKPGLRCMHLVTPSPTEDVAIAQDWGISSVVRTGTIVLLPQSVPHFDTFKYRLGFKGY